MLDQLNAQTVAVEEEEITRRLEAERARLRREIALFGSERVLLGTLERPQFFSQNTLPLDEDLWNGCLPTMSVWG